ncbi:MAG: beta-ketoacyl synthase chain length factor [Lentisphaeria bacterium]|nr:beta-ketoacyl synthase chain length factor [Lentisphaeria bacterium]
MSRAGISGMGVVSAPGDGVPVVRRGLYAPEGPVPRLPRRFETQLTLPVFEIPDPPETGEGEGLPLRFLLHALEEALKDAKLSRGELRARRVGIAVGTTEACQLDNIPCHARIRKGDLSDLAPALSYVRGMPAEYLRRFLGTSGPAVTVSNACASGADALMIALEWLRTGRCDLAIAGGCDSVSKVAFNGFNALRVCSGEPCRPFDAKRSGLNLGDAAGVLILEAPERAAARGVRAEYELGGAGKTADGFHITQPESSGRELERAVRLALAQAELTAGDIDFVNAHGTGTPVNDRVEGAVLARIFGAKLRYQSTKALTGHTLGAAGAIEAVFTRIMLEERRAAPSRRCSVPDPELPAFPLRTSVPVSGSAALSTSLAFGGSNTALVIRKCRPDVPDTGLVTPYIAGFSLLPERAPEREELAALCRKYGLRRPDRLTQLALAAAERLVSLPGGEETALVTVTAYGPASTNCRVLDDILDYPEEEILPTGFSHSVINAAASCLGAVYGIHGPTFALAGFEDPFFEAADLAGTLLSGKVCRRVLIVAADEASLTSRAVETLRCGGVPASPEGACALLLAADPGENRLGTLEIGTGTETAGPRLLPCGVPAPFAEALRTAGPGSRTVLPILAPPVWRLPERGKI